MNAVLPPALDELGLRVAAFGAVFAVLAIGEVVLPWRSSDAARLRRWSNHFLIAMLNNLLVRLVLPLGVSGFALYAERRGWGLLNGVEWAGWLEWLVAMIALDLWIYWQHRLFHWVPVLWRMHRVHHADPVFDLTTGFRFHPFEIMPSVGIKLVAVVLLGAPAFAVLCFEIVLSLSSLFTHANLRLPARLDHVLRTFIVTPDMHRVHHSILRAETDSNFGFNLSCWDRLFGSYRATASRPAEAHEFGVDGYRDPRQTSRLRGILALPFQAAHDTPVGGR